MSFSAERIPPAVLGSLFDAARWAPSSYGEQPWVFIVATQDQPAEFSGLLSCLMEANQVWAKQAYALILTCAKMHYSRNQKPNRHAYHDVGLATQNLMLQAISQGLFAHPMGGFEPQKARELLSIPDGCEPVAAIAVGYPAKPDASIADELRQRDANPRVRKPLTDFVFSGRWGKFAGPFS